MPGSPSPISSPAPSSPHSRSPPSAQLQSKTQENSGSARGRPLVELITTPFPAFDCESAVVVPFQKETARDDEFQKELNEMLLDAALQAHAWASARPFQETDIATRKFEQEIMVLQAQENEQGMPPPSLLFLFFEKTRQRLNEFVTRIRSALAALTGML
ncbi:hypothetical protein C8R45DRAFT_951908 [Mycena sanguinolenta]|nr:hypothetical protein C8R45DRAFT_951908 [Mycena sanguinolenta]